MKKIIPVLILCQVIIKSYGQITFQRIYPGGMGNFIQQTSDTGYILTYQNGILKLDQNGNIEWVNQNLHGNSIRQTDDGGYILSGIFYNFLIGDSAATLFKINQLGDSLWTKFIYDIHGAYGVSAIQSYNGGYAFACFQDGGTFTLAYRLYGTDSAGNQLWGGDNCGGGGDGWNWYVANGMSMQKTLDNCYITVCHSEEYTLSYPYLNIVKTDKNGSNVWFKTYDNYFPNSVSQNADSSYIIGGTGFIMKVDKNGDSLWVKEFPNYQINDIVENCSGGYLALEVTNNLINNVTTLLNLDANGDTIWTQQITGLGIATLNMLQKTIDNGFIMVGSTEDTTTHLSYLYVLKTDCQGNTGPLGMANIPPSGFIIYPNPSANTFTINLSLDLINSKLEIFDLLGQEVYKSFVYSTQQTISTNLNDGIYIVKISSNSQQFIKKLFIK